MKQDNTSIFFFTATFPYGNGEEFIRNELPFGAMVSDRFFLFPYSSSSPLTREVPEGVEVILKSENSEFSFIKVWANNFFFIFKIIFSEFFRTNKKRFFLKKLKHWNYILAKSIFEANSLNAKIKELQNPSDKTIFYSFWMNEWALILAILKQKGEIDNFVFRVLGFDIYDERCEGGYMPFRHFIYKNTFKVFPNSKKAVDYVVKKNIYPEKIVLSYLGTKNEGLSPFDPNEKFTIVSSSNIIPVKRVHLIANILSNISFPIRWYHFGAGKEQNKLLDSVASLPDNVELHLKGRFSNFEDYINFYKQTSINLFINVSSTEGLPVTLQEATSFGIPVVATDVGGNREVAEGNGIVLEADFDPKEAAKLIDNFRTSERNTLEFRQKVREFWEDKFQAKTQFERFLQEIL